MAALQSFQMSFTHCANPSKNQSLYGSSSTEMFWFSNRLTCQLPIPYFANELQATSSSWVNGIFDRSRTILGWHMYLQGFFFIASYEIANVNSLFCRIMTNGSLPRDKKTTPKEIKEEPKVIQSPRTKIRTTCNYAINKVCTYELEST